MNEVTSDELRTPENLCDPDLRTKYFVKIDLKNGERGPLLLANNSNLLNEMVEASATLLFQARYDADAYQIWAQNV